ncbi:SAM-dependent methyltransferase [Streptomyces lunaelactis]|uniref:SAM-dependent methyltransferase n=1 Tax=Streptomyces lunaelactis TaxID=1535768 RepID=A0A2R4T7M1_9ACTN|nr:class I SAM-dependent methyltransferase [Streptomyces lunaelactis]AVZ75097.1 SAM-dependent methyltransferase [Streptomyces lunaelactis]NUK84586.1 class I SAM-dependent methyltransferase [Streptomyces lunaelactis]
MSGTHPAADDPTGWFERVYAEGAGGRRAMPWDQAGPFGMLREWARVREVRGGGRRALVVGCGLGRDAEFIAGLGFDTDAFDISATAIRTARSRFPDSSVRYQIADLLNPPPEWDAAFDLVVESHTVQALPEPLRSEAIANVGPMVRPGGTLIVFAAVHDAAAVPSQGPPWPLTRTEIDAFAAAAGLAPVDIEELEDPDGPPVHRWRAEFRRPESDQA